MNKNEIKKLRGAILRAVKELDINIAEEMEDLKLRFTKEEIKLYTTHPTSELNRNIETIERLSELMGNDECVDDEDIKAVLGVKNILYKHKLLKTELINLTI